MPLLTLVIWLVLLGVVLYVINLIPMDPTIKRVIFLVVIVVVCIWLITMFMPSGGPTIPVHRSP